MTRDAVARLCLIAGLLHLSVSMPEAQTAAGTPPPTASNATIRARVLGASDGRPVRGATVRLEGQGAVTDWPGGTAGTPGHIQSDLVAAGRREEDDRTAVLRLALTLLPIAKS